MLQTSSRLQSISFTASLSLAFVLWPALSVRAQTSTRALAPGITYTQEITTGSAPLVVNVLRIDLAAPNVHIQTGQAQDVVSSAGPAQGRETMHSLATRHNALAAINADFFPFNGDPLGISVRDGEFLSEPLGYRACLGFSPRGVLMNVLLSVGTLLASDGATLSLSGINRVPHDGDMVVLTPTYMATPTADKNGFVITLRDVSLPVKLSQTMQGTVDSIAPIGSGESMAQTTGHAVQIIAIGGGAASLPMHLKQGDVVKFRFDVTPNTAPPARGKYASRADFLRSGRYVPVWTDVQQAVGGGPMLVRDGRIAVDGEAEGLPKADFIDKRHPRTAAGVDNRGCLLLVTVDGRSPWSRGASLDEMAAIMKRLGAVNAMNLDGGGSTTMVVGGGVVNAPSDGRERPVADGLLIYGNRPDVSAPDALQIVPLVLPTLVPGGVPNTVPTAVPTSTPNRDIPSPPNPVPTVPNVPPVLNNPTAVQTLVGQSLPLKVIDGDGSAFSAPNILWGTSDGFGFVSQQGVFTGSRPGSGTITARIGNRTFRLPVQVIAKSLPPRPSVDTSKPIPPPLPEPIDPDDKP